MANLQSVNPTYHDALDKYLISDAAQYNFGNMTDLYLRLIMSDHCSPKSHNNLIGIHHHHLCFSAMPMTYRMSTNNITFGTDKPFDAGYQPLYKREILSNVKSWFFYRSHIPNFATLFPEVDSYLSLTKISFKKKTSKNGFKLGIWKKPDLVR